MSSTLTVQPARLPTQQNTAVVGVSVNLASGAAPAPIASAVYQFPSISISSGNAAGQVDRAYSFGGTITFGTPFTINLSTGLDPLGNTLGMVHVTSVLVENDSLTAGQVMTIGGGTHPVLGSDQFTAQANGGIAFICNPNPGYSVSGGSSDTLTITVAAGTAVPFKVTVLGRSA